ncbi:hypothetical protein F5148DRAFT_14024 [Russula earlei]|uniref:Uncharacterized protein n=1 Tax=Russula earlei TaxID=71964 RepID=A0ACC0UMH8_9AGAM|nr:hypothetical protein F5148DRAFT_14024 [Russula earlei]
MGETKTISTLFYIGATGYIGGAVLADLVKVHPDLKITALVRNPSHFQAIRDLGVEIVRGSFGDVEIISSHARSADVTLNFGDSDDVTLNEAILAGQKARVEEDGKPRAILLHTSGVAELSDGGKEGKHDANGKLWNDGVEADIRSITPQMLHGQVDVPIFHASDQGYTESYTVCPAAVVGPSTGPIPASSAFFKYLTQFVLASKKPLYVGEGANLFHAVHLEDLVDLYRLVFARILSRTDAKASPYAR